MNLRKYLSHRGRKAVRTESHQRIGEFSGEFPNLTVEHLMKKRYADILGVPVFRRIMKDLAMGSAKGHPTAPMKLLAALLSSQFEGLDLPILVPVHAYYYGPANERNLDAVLTKTRCGQWNLGAIRARRSGAPESPVGPTRSSRDAAKPHEVMACGAGR